MREDSATVREMLRTSADAVRACLAIADDVSEAGKRIGDALDSGRQVVVFGNGGSAADAQHFAAELLGRYRAAERRPLAAVALSADGAVLTAVANDYDFADVFSRQVRALARPGDIVFAISTSGRSESVVRALREAPKGTVRIALLGRDRATLADVADITLAVPADGTAQVQAAHIAVIHAICELLESRFGGP
jgi:phosphoheptose isomerase